MLKKALNTFLYLLFLFISTLLLLEVCYRFYVIDFYKGSLTGLNSADDLMPGHDQQTVLVFGDSFTADTNSYVKYLRRDMPDYRIINTGVAGTSIRQHRLMAKSRIERFEPNVLIYQIYLGNDLLEYRHPINSDNIRWIRKAYWWLADHLLVVGYINTKLPQFRAFFLTNKHPGLGAKLVAEFSIEKYNARTKTEFKAEPQLLAHSILLQNERGEDFHSYVEEVADLLALAPPGCKVVVIVMPHCAQLGTPYLERMESMGAIFENKKAMTALNFPFYSALKKALLAEDRYFFNSLEYLNDKQKNKPAYYENDPHLNSSGQLLVGKALVDFFVNEVD